MHYKVYYTDANANGMMPDLSRLILPSFPTKELAIEYACALRKFRGMGWKIAGPEGFVMTQAEFERKNR